MARALKILGQSNPSATTLTTLYTVPSATSATVASISVCNQAAAATTFRVSTAIGGVADTTRQYLYYDTNIDGNSTVVATIGITLSATDTLRVYAGTAGLSFSAFGVEVT